MIDQFLTARRDPRLAVLEGFHALKHALRFGADIVSAVGTGPDDVAALAAELAPDVADQMLGSIEWVDEAAFGLLAPEPPATGVIAIARRPRVDPESVVGDSSSAPIVFLERPNHFGNIGAVVRVAAAAGAAGVLTTGDRDPWHPAAIRGSAGLHFAQPVVRIADLVPGDRPLIALDPDGTPLNRTRLPNRALFAFGSERRGLSTKLADAADLRLAIPMRPGVSSLNLATSVAIVLYLWSATER